MMDFGNSMGAVACPVCTLFLREGISLQKHLDTHPKEQVIDALIKASASTSSQLNDSTNQTPSSPNQIANQPQVNTASHVSSPSSYPVGPLFECPSTLNAVLSPQQFSSFSYQQFVNNGTVMIPQYAMAPQTNHMMQMLYSPYGMYHQQPVPTVQMISPVTPTTATTAIGAANSAVRIKSANIPSVSDSSIKINHLEKSYTCSETRQILPEIVQETESQVLLSETDIALCSSACKERSIHCDRIVDNPLRVEHREQQTQASNEEERNEDQRNHQETTVQANYQDSIALEIINSQHEQSQLNIESKHISLIEEKISTVSELSKDSSSVFSVDSLNKIEQEVQEEQEDKSNESKSHPEVEQLEHLLITIVGSEYHNENASECNEPQNIGHIPKLKEASKRKGSKNNDFTSNISDFNRTFSVASESLIINVDANQTYYYKQSLSEPSSPLLLKRTRRTHSRLSLRSDFGSNENVSMYAIDFESTAVHNYEDAKNENGVDEIEMEGLASNALVTNYDKVERECAASHTSSSIGSSNSVMQVCSDPLKPGSPLSDHSLSSIEIDITNCTKVSFDQNDSSTEQNLVNSEFQEMTRSCSEESTPSCNSLGRLKTKSEKKSSPKEIDNQIVNSHHQQSSVTSDSVKLLSDNTLVHGLIKLSDAVEPTTSTNSQNVDGKIMFQKPTAELFNLNEDAHSGSMNVFEFDGLQILVPSTFITESSEKAVSSTSQQSLSSSEGGTCIDEEIKSINMRADESMPPRGELSEQESNECTEQSTWQVS